MGFNGFLEFDFDGVNSCEEFEWVGEIVQSVEFSRSFGGCLAEILWQWQWRWVLCSLRFLVFNLEILRLGWCFC